MMSLPTSPSSLCIRSALPADAPDLQRLAALDSRRPPTGAALVALVGGELVAAYDVERGERIGNPFRPTAEVLNLLELHAAPSSARARGRRAWPAVSLRTA